MKQQLHATLVSHREDIMSTGIMLQNKKDLTKIEHILIKVSEQRQRRISYPNKQK
jgi:hypothetical protein